MNQEQKDYFYAKNFTLKGRIFYPELFVPKVAKNSTNPIPKYSVLFAWPINDATQQAALQEIGNYLGTAKQNFWPTIPDVSFNKPLKKYGVYQKRDGSPVQDFLKDMYWMNLSANEKFAPRVVDEQRQDVLDHAQVWSGRNAAVNFSFYGYNANGNVGIAANVKAVMLLEGGDKVVGSSGVDLGTAFGQFAADMGGAYQEKTTVPEANVTPQSTQANPVNAGGGFI